MWLLQRLPTTDENPFLRMTGWRSSYIADPTRDRGVLLADVVVSNRVEERSPVPENTQSPYIIYL
ncbi:hypothetical protein J6590_035033, partial [Homalodisca vitripennis]